MGAAEDLEQLNDRLPFPSNVTISPSITVSLGRSAMPLGHCSKTTSEVFFGCVTRVARSVPTYDQFAIAVGLQLVTPLATLRRAFGSNDEAPHPWHRNSAHSLFALAKRNA